MIFTIYLFPNPPYEIVLQVTRNIEIFGKNHLESGQYRKNKLKRKLKKWQI